MLGENRNFLSLTLAKHFTLIKLNSTTSIFKSQVQARVCSVINGEKLTHPQLMNFNPQGPVAQKIADEVVFRRFQGEGVEFFFKSDLTDPPQIFDAPLLVNTDLSPSRFHFSVGFI